MKGLRQSRVCSIINLSVNVNVFSAIKRKIQVYKLNTSSVFWLLCYGYCYVLLILIRVGVISTLRIMLLKSSQYGYIGMLSGYFQLHSVTSVVSVGSHNCDAISEIKYQNKIVLLVLVLLFLKIFFGCNVNFICFTKSFSLIKCFKHQNLRELSFFL